MCCYTFNPYRQADPGWDRQICTPFEGGDILAVHRSIREYAPTPLVSLPSLAKQLEVGRILVKDESQRFGLKAFKALGSSYAVYRFLERYIKTHGGPPCDPATFYRKVEAIKPEMVTFCTATDGNHGRAVAWAARKLRQRAVIFVPRNTVSSRIDSITGEGAEVVVVPGNYDQAVEEAARAGDKNGWQIISDTSWPGYTEIPRWVMAGYTTLFREVHERQNTESVDVVFVQAGVGAFAGAAAWYYRKTPATSAVRLVAVEPTEADCLLQSIRSADGSPTQTQGRQNSIMAGLNCGRPSLVAWPLVKTGMDLFMTVSDVSCIKSMRTYYYPRASDPRIISGESGAAGLAALMDICQEESMALVRERLGITSKSTILLINTEGNTDPELFNNLVVLNAKR